MAELRLEGGRERSHYHLAEEMKDLRTRESAEEIRPGEGRRDGKDGKGWRPQQPEEFGAVKVGAVSAVKDNGLLAKGAMYK